MHFWTVDIRQSTVYRFVAFFEGIVGAVLSDCCRIGIALSYICKIK